MTREEAIQAIGNLLDMNIRYHCDTLWIDALRMAIEALSEPINCVKCKHYYETADDTDVHGRCRMDTAHTELVRFSEETSTDCRAKDDYDRQDDNQCVADTLRQVDYRTDDDGNFSTEVEKIRKTESFLGDNLIYTDLIRRSDAVEAIDREIENATPINGDINSADGHYRFALRLARNLIADLPTADRPLTQTDTLIIADALEYLMQDKERHDEDRAKARELREQILQYGASMCRPQGEWIEDGQFWKCSNCGARIYSETEADRTIHHAFCGVCGARMEVGHEAGGK